MGTEVIVGLALAAAAAGASAYNTNRTERRQDQALAQGIRNQSARQRAADAKVQAEVQKLEQSRSEDERATALQNYAQTLKRNTAAMQQGLTPGVGSDTFKADAAQAAADTNQYAQDTAGLMARIDAPNLQRQGEAFSRGMLGTDLDVEARGARGQAFLDELRLRGIRRNPWIDAAASIAGSYGGSMARGGSSEGMQTGNTLNSNAYANAGVRPGSAGGMYNGYYVPPSWGG